MSKKQKGCFRSNPTQKLTMHPWRCFSNLIAYSPFFVSCLCLLKFNLDHTLEFFRVQSYSMLIAPNQMSWLSPIKKATEKMIASFFPWNIFLKNVVFCFPQKVKWLDYINIFSKNFSFQNVYSKEKKRRLHGQNYLYGIDKLSVWAYRWWVFLAKTVFPQQVMDKGS